MTPVTKSLAIQRGTVPYILLHQGDGRTLDLWQYKGRRNLVLFVAHSTSCPECRSYLKALASRYREFQEWETELIALVPGKPEEVLDLTRDLDLPNPVALEQAGMISFKLGLADEASGRGSQAGLVVADRWGEIYGTFKAGGGHELPSGDEVLKDLRFIEIQCPECGVGG